MLTVRFSEALERVDPPFGPDERRRLSSTLSRAVGSLSTEDARDLCASSDRVDQLSQLLLRAYDVPPNDPVDQATTPVTVTVTDSPRYLWDFDKAFYVGRALMRAIQIDRTLAPVNENGKMVAVFEGSLQENPISIVPSDVGSTLEGFDLIDRGPIGRARVKYEEEYEKQLERLRANEHEVRLLVIENRHAMAMTLENNRSSLMEVQEQTRGEIEVAQEGARATIEAARLNAEARMYEARLRQQSKPGFFGSLLSTVGGLVGTAVGGPVLGAVGSKLSSVISPEMPAAGHDDNHHADGHDDNHHADAAGCDCCDASSAMNAPRWY